MSAGAIPESPAEVNLQLTYYRNNYFDAVNIILVFHIIHRFVHNDTAKKWLVMRIFLSNAKTLHSFTQNCGEFLGLQNNYQYTSFALKIRSSFSPIFR